jgi:phosphate transport system substrate-binding protein
LQSLRGLASHGLEPGVRSALVAACAAALVAGCGPAAPGRDSISVAGSSTVYPFATLVAERFGRTTDFHAPRIESTGSGGGLKLFCRGLGAATPDIANSSRRMRLSEYRDCLGNGVTHVVEVVFGFDGIAIASSASSPPVAFTLTELFQALARDLPGPDGQLAPNPHRRWSDINPALPATEIEILGPPPTSGTRDALAELVLAAGALGLPSLAALRALRAEQVEELGVVLAGLGVPDSAYWALQRALGRPPSGEDLFASIAHAVREDGAYIEAGENDNLIVQKLEANPGAFGVFGFNVLEENDDRVRGATVEGIAPSFASIADGDYPISRPLYFYIKAAHVGRIPGIREYARAFTSERAIGPEGYLPERGLVPLKPEQRAAVRKRVETLARLVM